MTPKSLLKTCKALTRFDHVRTLIEHYGSLLEREVRLGCKHFENAFECAYFVVKYHLQGNQKFQPEYLAFVKTQGCSTPEEYLWKWLNIIRPWCDPHLAKNAIEGGISKKDFVNHRAEQFVADKLRKKSAVILERPDVPAPEKSEPIPDAERIDRLMASNSDLREKLQVARSEISRLNKIVHSLTNKLDLFIKETRRNVRKAS